METAVDQETAVDAHARIEEFDIQGDRITTLTADECADLYAAYCRAVINPAGGFAVLLAHATELADAYYAAGLVEGDLAHDGTIRAEAAAE